MGHQCFSFKCFKEFVFNFCLCFNLGGGLEQLATSGVGSDADFIPNRGHCGGATWNGILSPNEVSLSDYGNGPSKWTAGVTCCGHGSQSDRSGRTSLASWTGNGDHVRARGRGHGYGCGCWSSSECGARGNATEEYGCGI